MPFISTCVSIAISLLKRQNLYESTPYEEIEADEDANLRQTVQMLLRLPQSKRVHAIFFYFINILLIWRTMSYVLLMQISAHEVVVAAQNFLMDLVEQQAAQKAEAVLTSLQVILNQVIWASKPRTRPMDQKLPPHRWLCQQSIWFRYCSAKVTDKMASNQETERTNPQSCI